MFAELSAWYRLFMVRRISLVVLLAMSCSSEPSTRATRDAGALIEGGAGASAADAGSTCTELAADGALVSVATQAARSSAPAPSGGTIAEGIYELTGAAVYGDGSTALGESSVWRFAGDVLEQASRGATDGPAQRFRAHYAITSDDQGRQRLAWSCVCATEGPSCTERAGVFTRLYSATGDTLVYFNDDPDDPTNQSVLVRTFTRRR